MGCATVRGLAQHGLGRRRATAAAATAAAVAAAAVAGLLAGCGTYHTQDQPARGVPASVPAAGGVPPSPSPGPPAGSRAQALALATRLVARLDLPPGARRVHPRVLPGLLRQPEIPGGSPHQVDIHLVVALRQPMSAAQAFLGAHVPRGMRFEGRGQGSGPSGVTTESLSYALRSLPTGIDDAELVAAVVPAPGGSLLRADAEVIWYPPRTTAEHVSGAAVRAVRITARVYNPTVHTVTTTITSRAVIARLAGTLNAMGGAPYQPPLCPAIFVTFRLTFIPTAPAAPRMLADPTGCATVRMTVGGTAQPLLWDPGARLAGIAQRLLHLKPPV